MSETRDEATGQFAPVPEQLFGKEAAERDAGYIPLKDEAEQPENDGELTIEEAAADLTAERTAEGAIKTYSAIDDLPENVTLTLEQAAQSLTDAHEAERLQAEEDQIAEVQRKADDLRGDNAAETAAAEIPIERALELPQIKEAIEKVTRESVEAREKHVSGLAAATSIAEQSILGKYPELANIAPEQRLQAFAAIAQNDPDRASAIQADIANLASVFTQYTAENERLSAERQQQFQSYAKAESDRFETMVASTPQAERTAIEKNIVEAITEHGGDLPQFVKLMHGSEFASATVQMLLWEVGKYRQIMKASKAISAKPVPTVQRPGIRGPRVASGEAQLASLERQFDSASGEKQLRLGAQIQSLSRKIRNG